MATVCFMASLPLLGTVSFAPPVDVPIPDGSPTGAFSVDLDGDGRSDVVLNYKDPGGKPRIATLRRVGAGFAEAVVLPWTGEAQDAGDLDGDGISDLVISEISPGGVHSIRFFRGKGDGTFVDTGLALPGSYVRIGDVDGDGRADLVVFTTEGPSWTWVIATYRNQGAWTFASWPHFPLNHWSIGGITVADVNRDGRADVLLWWQDEYRYQAGATVYLGNGSGGFVEGQNFGTPAPVLRLIADLNGDGNPDLVEVFSTEYPDYGAPRLAVRYGDGKGNFRGSGGEVRYWRYDGRITSVVADLDGDGRPEMAVGTAVLTVGTNGLTGSPVEFGNDPSLVTLLLSNGPGELPDLGSLGGGLVVLRNTSCQTPVGTSSIFIPAVLRTEGTGGSRFVSDVVLTNRGETPVTLSFTYTPFAGAGGGISPPVVVQAGTQLTLAPDALHALHLLGAPVPDDGSDGGGTLRVDATGLSADGVLSATARTQTGGYGVSYRGVSPSNSLSLPSYVPWLTESARDRTNLAIAHAGGSGSGEIALRVTVTSTDSGHTGSWTSPEIVLQEGGFFQWNRILLQSGLGASSAFAFVERVRGNAPYRAYSVINDNLTSDGSLVEAVDLAHRPLYSTFVPVAVDSDRFHTQLVVTNLTSGWMNVTLEWTAEAITTADHTARFQVTFRAYGQWAVDDLAAYLRSQGVAGIPADPAALLAGPLRVTALAQYYSGELPWVGARVWNEAAGGGRYGVMVPAIQGSDAPRTEAWIDDLRTGPAVRSNLGLVNNTDRTMTLGIEVFDGASGTKVLTLDDLRVPPYGWYQVNDVLGKAPGTTRAFARITNRFPPGTFAAYGVINDGNLTPGTNDGSFVNMIGAR